MGGSVRFPNILKEISQSFGKEANSPNMLQGIQNPTFQFSPAFRKIFTFSVLVEIFNLF